MPLIPLALIGLGFAAFGTAEVVEETNQTARSATNLGGVAVAGFALYIAYKQMGRK